MSRPWVFAAALLVAAPAVAQTTFTYQGRLDDGGSPASGTFDFQFILYDAAVGGSQVGPLLVREDVAVAAGLFTVRLDFGAAYDGGQRWLDIAVRPGASSGTFTPVLPRQELTPAPAAAFSAAAPWGGITGMPAGFADGIDDTGGGTVTSITAGAGLTGGTITTAGTMAVAFGGSGSLATVSRTDHNHDAAYAALSHNHFGQTWSGSANPGLRVVTSGARALRGESTSSTGIGVVGHATATTGPTFGVLGESTSPDGIGVHGVATATSGGATGVHGLTSSPSGRGVIGEASGSSGIGVLGSGGSAGVSTGVRGTGVNGVTGSGINNGVTGTSTGTPPVRFLAAGVRGGATGGGYAGYFDGDVHVTGTLSKGAGSFKIDHPLDPENKYLYHSFVESPDMKNVYDGVVITDARGFAAVELPEWFEALNRDFRYQLTVVGQFAQAIVAEEIAASRFVVRTDRPGVKVCWQVTGIRKDPFAEKHRIPVEEDKHELERGTFLHPEAWGQPKARGVDEILRVRE